VQSPCRSISGFLILAGLTLLQAQVQTYTCPTGFGPIVAVPVCPAVLMQSLRDVENPVLPSGPFGPVRDDLADYIANQPAAVQLGKALFWDMQSGSDGKTACATCHFKAGADGRDKNQLNPGANNSWDALAGIAPNYSFNAGGNDFPFTIPSNRDTDNIAGSQGVRISVFKGFVGQGGELTSSVADPVFNVNGVNVRQVTGKILRP